MRDREENSCLPHNLFLLILALAVGVACVIGFALFCIFLGIGGTFLIAALSSGENLPNDKTCEWGKKPDLVWMCGAGDEFAPEVLYVPIRGIIAPPSLESSILDTEEATFKTALKAIRSAIPNTTIRGLYLMLDTPGGTVTESDILANAIQRFKASDSNRFVIVEMGGLCCSGGYYVAANADWIVAHPTTMTGSIGVIMNGFNAAGLAQKLGIESVTIASGNNKALLDPFKPVDPKHIDILKRPVVQDYERFLAIVAHGRNLPIEKIRPLADGRVLSAQDALKAGLVDQLGYTEEVVEKAAELAQAKAIRVYRSEDPFSLRQLFSPSACVRWGAGLVRGMKAELRAENTMRSEYRMNP